MAVIAIIAINCAAFRAGFFGTRAMPLLGGLLPLANFVLIAFYVISKRFRISLRRQVRERRAARIFWFGAVAGMELMALVIASLVPPFQELVERYFAMVTSPIAPWFDFLSGSRLWVADILLFPLIVGIVLSGPPLVLAYAIAWVTSWFELVGVPGASAAG